MSLDKYLPYADVPTPAPEVGQWRLIAPSGKEFAAPSPIQCVRLEQGLRVPAHVALGRIARGMKDDSEPSAEAPAQSAPQTHPPESTQPKEAMP